MPWLTELIGTTVADSQGRKIGRVRDVVAERTRFPTVTGLIVQVDDPDLVPEPGVRIGYVAWQDLSRDYILRERSRFERVQRGDRLFISEELLDQQIVDIDGARVVRVNDVLLQESAGGLRVVGVDVGLRGFLRRLGLENLATRMADALAYQIPGGLIAWNYVAPLGESGGEVRLNVPTRMLRELHPSELADILDQLDGERRERILRVMSVGELAETLAETEPHISREAVELLGEERARRVIESMPPDEATDLLGIIGYQRSEHLLSLMGVHKASQLRELLGYPPDTAGGRMTPAFISVLGELTVAAVIDRIRSEAALAETVNYAYVVDRDARLEGVFSLRDLLRAPGDLAISELMQPDVVVVELDDDQEEVARAMTRYNLLAIPVVDSGFVLKGIVTVDDVVDVLEEEASEDLAQVSGVYVGTGGATSSRVVGFGSALLGGLAGTLLLRPHGTVLASLVAVAWLLPLYLRTTLDLGTWSLARSLGAFDLDPKTRLDTLAHELAASLGSAAFSGALVAGFSALWTRSASVAIFLGIGIFVGSLAASLIGLGLPSLARSLHLSRLLTRGRPLATIVGFSSLLVYVWALGSLSGRLH